MKRSILLTLLITISMYSHAQNQMDQNQKAKNDYDRADRELSAIYDQVQKKYRQNPKMIKNLKLAHRLWIEYRLAEVSVKFPAIDGDPFDTYGDSFPECYYSLLTEITQDRIAFLRRWLEGEQIGCTSR